MQQWFLAIFGVVAAGAGHLFKRWLQRDPRSERMKLRLEALTLLSGLRRERLSLRELDQFVDETAPTSADTGK